MPVNKDSQKLTVSLISDQQYDAFGDAANALVLQKRAEWSGVEAQVVPLDSKASVGDLLVIAGGTDSSFLEFAEQITALKENIESAIAKGIPTLVTGVAIRALIDAGILPPYSYEPDKHFADDAHVDAGEGLGKITGFVNTRWKYSFGVFAISENLVLTQFAGPVLARNPQLADWMLKKAGVFVKDSENIVTSNQLAKTIVTRILND